MGAAKEDGKVDLKLKTMGDMWWKDDGLGSEFKDTLIECSGGHVWVDEKVKPNRADGLGIKRL